MGNSTDRLHRDVLDMNVEILKKYLRESHCIKQKYYALD